MKMTNKLNQKLIMRLAFLYLTLPVIVFFLGYCKKIVGIPAAIVLVVCLLFIFREKNLSLKTEIDAKLWKVIVIVAIIAVWVFFSGIGGLAYQNSDQVTRNQIFELLVAKDWPVVGHITSYGNDEFRALSYYIGFWMVPAAVGKWLGIANGYLMQYLWAVFGVCITYGLICIARKKVQIWPLLAFVFFSGLTTIAPAVVQLTGSSDWQARWKFISTYLQLYWQFNQCISIWIVILLLYLQKNNRYVVFIMSMAILSATISLIGTLPFAIFFALFEQPNDDGKWQFKGNLKNIWRELTSFENLFGGGITALITGSFIMVNQSMSITGSIKSMGKLAVVDSTAQLINSLSIGTTTIHNTAISANTSSLSLGSLMIINSTLGGFLLFILCSYGIYFALMYFAQRKNTLFYFTGLVLLVVPFGRIGVADDFCVKTAVPAQMMLFLMFIEAIDIFVDEHKRALLIGLLMCFAISAFNSIYNYYYCVKYTVDLYKGTDDVVYIKKIGTLDESIIGYSNFSGDLDDTLFFRVFAEDNYTLPNVAFERYRATYEMLESKYNGNVEATIDSLKVETIENKLKLSGCVRQTEHFYWGETTLVLADNSRAYMLYMPCADGLFDIYKDVTKVNSGVYRVGIILNDNGQERLIWTDKTAIVGTNAGYEDCGYGAIDYISGYNYDTMSIGNEAELIMKSGNTGRVELIVSANESQAGQTMIAVSDDKVVYSKEITSGTSRIYFTVEPNSICRVKLYFVPDGENQLPDISIDKCLIIVEPLKANEVYPIALAESTYGLYYSGLIDGIVRRNQVVITADLDTNEYIICDKIKVQLIFAYISGEQPITVYCGEELVYQGTLSEAGTIEFEVPKNSAVPLTIEMPNAVGEGSDTARVVLTGIMFSN